MGLSPTGEELKDYYEDGYKDGSDSKKLEGMSLRDHFAARAMQGIVGSIDSEDTYNRLRNLAMRAGFTSVSEWVAKDAYKQADAMIKARNE